MSGTISRVIKAVFGTMGLEVRLRRNVAAHEERVKRDAWRSAWRERWDLFSQFPIRTILDIGAHKGEFATMIHQVLPEAQILAFEPLADCYQEVDNLAASLPNIRAFNVALGSSTGTVPMMRSDYSPSSSLLPMGQLHRDSFPFSAGTKAEIVNVTRLDDVLSGESLERDILIKIDAQGYTGEILRGGAEVVSRARFVVVEASCYELYEGEPLFKQIHEFMQEMGFVYRGNVDQLISPVDRTILQVDAFFERIMNDY
jgi:FkbM family methyltransferase